MKIGREIQLDRDQLEIVSHLENTRWYHYQRLSVIKHQNGSYFIAHLNLFERIFHHFLHLFSSNSTLKNVKLLSSSEIPWMTRIEVSPSTFPSIPLSTPAPSLDDSKARFLSKIEADKNNFLTYQDRQMSLGKSVDLVIARGKRNNPDYPELCKTRFSFRQNCQVDYSPLHVDCCKEEEPDIQLDVTSVLGMTCFPDNSFDDIFMERIFPACPQVSFQTYYNVARILKVGGTFVMDANGLCNPDQMESVKEKFSSFFEQHEIPLRIYTHSFIRNHNHCEKSAVFSFYKTEELKIDWSTHKEKVRIACDEMHLITKFIKNIKN